MVRMRTDEFLLSQSRVMLGRQRLFVDGLSQKSKDKLKVSLTAAISNIYVNNYIHTSEKCTVSTIYSAPQQLSEHTIVISRIYIPHLIMWLCACT